jgi:hypothetical protein
MLGLSSIFVMKVQQHDHSPVAQRRLATKSGVPYEVERRVCAICGRVLEERTLRRAVT